jgi:putative isomerase
MESTLASELIADAAQHGKPAWRAMLRYTAELHARSTHPAASPFPYDWEEIGPGYCYGPAFGHWDIVHAILDTMPAAPEHARQQLLNNFANQMPDGLIPGSIYLRAEGPRWSREFSHPPLWVAAVDDYLALPGLPTERAAEMRAAAFAAFERQAAWFEAQRKADPGEATAGYFYRDILTFQWESGVDEGIRFLNAQPGRRACIDACAHVYGLYEAGARWASELGRPAEVYAARAAELRAFIQIELYDPATGYFYDSWLVHAPEPRPMPFEGIFPLISGAAAPEQAARVIDEYILNPRRFFSAHPIATVGVEDPHFELRMWRGPAWNSMTLWTARACQRYNRPDAARLLLERALDDSAAQFARTGTIWEFYHPHGGAPEDVRRKPHTPYNMPCRDYLGHNPLIAMARLFDELA